MTMQCASCGIENLDGAKFCRGCGGALADSAAAKPEEGGTTCPACGNPCKPGVRFCNKCGHALQGAEPAPASTGPQPEAQPSGQPAAVENPPGDAPADAAPADGGGKAEFTVPAAGAGQTRNNALIVGAVVAGLVAIAAGAFYLKNKVIKDLPAETAVTQAPAPVSPRQDAAPPEKPKAPEKPLPKAEAEQASPVVKPEPPAAALAEVKKSAPKKEPPPPQREFQFNAPPPGNKAPAPQNQAGTLSLPAFVIRQEESHRPARREKPSADENRRHLEDLDRKLRGE
jgi:Meckel syndrome type 1 protein